MNLGLAILAIGVMSFAGVLIETAMNVTFPTLMQQFNIATADVQWVTTIYLLTIAVTVPLSTYLFRNYSIRGLFIFANLTFLIGLLIDFLAPSFLLLLAGRLLQGVATGIALPLMFHIILVYAPIRQRGTMMGIGTLTTSIAPAIGPTYGGILTTQLSWHFIFIFLVPVLLLSLVLGLKVIPYHQVEKTGRLDMVSLFGLGLLFTGTLIFLSQLGRLFGWVALAFAIWGAWIFWHQSRRCDQPLINIKVLENRTFRLFLLGFLVCQFLLLGISFVLPNLIQIVNGKSAFIAGLVMLLGATVGALLLPLSGKLLDNWGAKRPILFGLGLSSLGWGLLTLILGVSPLWGFVFSHVVYMVGSGLAYSNLMTTGMSAVSDEMRGDGNAIFNTLQQFSGAVATSLVATIINVVQNHSQLGYQKATVLGSQLALFVLFLALIVILWRCWLFFRTPKAS